MVGFPASRLHISAHTISGSIVDSFHVYLIFGQFWYMLVVGEVVPMQSLVHRVIQRYPGRRIGIAAASRMPWSV